MPKRVLRGRVVSAARAKTVTVSVERRFLHPVQKKTVRRTKKYQAHDEAGTAGLGDIVRIRECPPVSRTKRWELLAVDEAPKKGLAKVGAEALADEAPAFAPAEPGESAAGPAEAAVPPADVEEQGEAASPDGGGAMAGAPSAADEAAGEPSGPAEAAAASPDGGEAMAGAPPAADEAAGEPSGPAGEAAASPDGGEAASGGENDGSGESDGEARPVEQAEPVSLQEQEGAGAASTDPDQTAERDGAT